MYNVKMTAIANNGFKMLRKPSLSQQQMLVCELRRAVMQIRQQSLTLRKYEMYSKDR